jgi:putative ABC transport system permease protein
MTGVIKDLRYALRGLLRNRGYTQVAVLSLALGIGANTTMFTLLRAILFRPLPVRDPAGLAAVFTTDARNPGLLLCSYPNYRDYQDHNTVFSSLLLYTAVTVNLTGRGDPQLLLGQLVSANYFATVGVATELGQAFQPADDTAPGGAPTAILSHALWMRLFGGDRGAIGRSIELNGRPYQVVGVAPEGFYGLNQLSAADVFLPLSMYPVVYPGPAVVPQRRMLLFGAAGRLKPGVSRAQAESAMQSLAAELERQYPLENRGRSVKLTPIGEAALSSRTRPVISQAGTVLMAISALVLLIGCGNVANLLLARSAGRTREIALRLAVGASRGRLVRQLLTESLVLAIAGGGAGLALAYWARELLWSLRPPIFNHAGFQLELDLTVLLFTLMVSTATGIGFGLAPALRATRPDLVVDLKERTGTGSMTRGIWRPRSLLVVAQVTLALVALTGASLFVRSLVDAGKIDPGFDAAHLGIVAYNVNDQGYSEARGREYHERALAVAARVPGVEAAGLSVELPFHPRQRALVLEGQDPGQARPTLTCVVWPGYFQAVRMPLERGRDFNLLDTKATPRMVVVNRTAADTFWPGQDPIGKRISFAGEGLPVEVVGVVRTANYQDLGEPPQALVYLSMEQYYFPSAVLHVRTSGDPAKVVAAVRRELQGLDRSLVLQAESMQVTFRDLLWIQRLAALVLAVFGGLATTLAMIGIYGVIAYSVRQRTREMGVRMALGARPRDVQFLVLGEGIELVAAGVIAGSLLSLAMAGSVESLLFLRSSRDVFTFTMVPALMASVGALACWIPATRASRTPPAEALREE